MVVIILADADHVLRQRADRCGELGARERDRRPVVERLALPHQLDDVAQIAQRAAADRKRLEAVALDGAENLALRAVDGCDFHGGMLTLLEWLVDGGMRGQGASKDGGRVQPILDLPLQGGGRPPKAGGWGRRRGNTR